MIDLLSTTDLVAVCLGLTAGGGALASLLVLVTDYPWSAPRHAVADDLTTLLPSRTVARPVGERTGGARMAGPRAAVADTAPITPRPYVTHAASTGDVYDQAPVLVVDSPPGALGRIPTPDLGVPIVRRYCCSYCRDGADVVGDSCVWCREPNPVAVRA